MSNKAMQFLYGDRELLLGVKDLLVAPVEVIVNPANGGLSHGGGLAAAILDAAGPELESQCDTLISEYGQLDSGMAVYTDAGRLPYKAVVHAVGPKMGEGDEQRKIEQAVSRSLLLCETNGWNSIAFPAISTGIFNVPVEICAQAFFRSITSFWDARHECEVEKVVICLTQQHFQAFFDAFRDDAIQADDAPQHQPVQDEEKVLEVGHVALTEQDIQDLEDDEINDWFK